MVSQAEDLPTENTDGTVKQKRNTRQKETTEQFQARTNLKMISDVYRNHWEVYLKGFALYITICLALIAASGYKDGKGFIGIFVGLALVIASGFSFYGCVVANRFMKAMLSKVEKLSHALNYESFMDENPVQITAIMKWISLTIGVSGIVQLSYAAWTLLNNATS